MAERLDARLSVRPASDRSFSEMNQPEKASVDPLFELARIVSGRSPNSTPGAARRAVLSPVPASGARPDVVGDLEAELLNDLQASFQAVRDLAPAKPLPPPLRPVETKPAEPPAPQARAAEGVVRERLTDALAALAPVIKLDRSVETATPGPAPSVSRPPSGPVPGASVNAANTNAPPAPEAGQPSMSPATAGRLRDALAALTEPSQPVPTAEAAFSRVPDERAAPRPAASYGASSAHLDFSNLKLGGPISAPGTGAARSLRSRWEKPVDGAQAPASASRFAAPKVAEREPPPFSLETEDDELFAQGESFAEGLPPLPDHGQADEFELPDAFAEDDVPADHELSAYGRGHSRRRLMGFVLVAGILLAGGGAFWLMRGAPAETVLPPIVLVPPTPNKVVPPTQVADQASKANYDRATDTSPTTTLVTPPPKVAGIPASGTGKSPLEILYDTTSGGVSGAESADATLANEPKRVRTVTFDRNGAPITSDATPLTPPSSALAPPSASPPIVRPVTPQATLAPAPVQPQVAVAQPRPSGNETQNVAGAGAGNGPNGELVITTTPGTPTPSPSPSGGPAPVPQKPAAIALAPTPAPAAPSATGSVAKPAQPAPAPTTTAAPTTTVAPAASAAPGWMVQVSSQKNEDGARATFKDLQAHYPKILGAYAVNVQRADLGDKGVYFRARVGPFSQSDAKRLCDDLKAAGGDCIVQPG